MRVIQLPRRRSWFDGLSVTGWLIVVNIAFFVLVYLIAILSKTSINDLITNYIAIQPSSIFAGKKLWTFLTSMFMHGGPTHLLINMFVLYSLGGLSEKIIGKKRFFWFYIASGIFAGLVFVLLAQFFGNTEIGVRIFGSPMSYAVGASGAIFAIAGLFVILTPRLKFYIIFLPFWGLPAYIMIPLVLVLTWVVSAGVGFGVGNTAHLGGLLAGVFYGLYLRNKYKRKVAMLSRQFR